MTSGPMPLNAPQEPWKKTLLAMAVVQFAMSASLMVQGPIMPLFLPQIGVQLGGPVEFWSGVLSSVNFLVAAFVSPIWGSLSDRYGRKAMVLRSSIAICIFMGIMGFAQSLSQLIALRALMGAFNGFSAAAIALVATQVPDNKLGFALGWLATSQLVGTLMGPVVGGAIADISGSYRVVFFCTSLIAAIAVIIAWLAVPNVKVPDTGKARASFVKNIGTLLRTGGLLPLFGVLLIAQIGVRSVQPVVVLFVQDLTGPVPALATLAGFAISVTGLADILVSPFLGKRSDTLGYRRVLLISLLGAAIMTFPQAGVENYWQFLALRFGVGMFLGGILPTANALIARIANYSHRGLAFGLTASATALGSCLGPLLGGTIAASAGLRWVFPVTGALFVINLIWVYLVVPSELPIRDVEIPSEPAAEQPEREKRSEIVDG